MVDFIEASPLRYALTVKPTIYVSHFRQFWSTTRIETTEEGTQILAIVDGIHRTVTESSLRRNLKLKDEEGISSCTPTEPHHTPFPEAQPPSYTTHSSSSLPPVTTTIPAVTPSETTPIRQYTRRARIAQSSAFPTVADEPASPLRDVSQGEAYPTDSGFIANQDRATIAKSSTLPYDSAPRVTSPAADEGSMQIYELIALCTSLQRKHSELLAKFQAQEVEINRSLDEGNAAAERISDDSEEMATVLTFMDAATVLARGIADVPTCSGSIPTASPPADEVPTGSDVVPTATLVFATATVVTPYRRRKGKEVMVVSKTPKKQIVQKQIDAQVARELEEQLEREDQRRSEQIARDAEITKIHVEEELQSMIDGLDRNNETTSEEVPEEVKSSEEVSEEKIKEMIHLAPIEKITRLGGSSTSYQFFTDLLKHLDRDDLNQLWSLVKETLSNRPLTSDKEMELWVELSRLYEPDVEDQLWTHTQHHMHAPVENYSRMANYLVLKMYKIASTPTQQGRIVENKMHKAFPLPVIEFPLAEEVPTASEEGCHCQKKRDATARKIALLSKSRRNCQSKMAVTLS
nr:hypothetical protein [Tanacetum cinerariifolium]